MKYLNLFRWPMILAAVVLLLFVGLRSIYTSPEILSPRQPGVAPVYPDYQDRNAWVSGYEATVQEHPSFLSLRLLAEEYLKRFREVGDPEDLLRAEEAARRVLGIKAQPESSRVSAYSVLASALVGQHRFAEALAVAQQGERIAPEPLQTQLASILMELGEYEQAEQHLSQVRGGGSVQARYLELTGHLQEARQMLQESMAQMDRFYTNPAELRSWFHMRTADLAFLAGALDEAEYRYREALQIYPQQVPALTGLARLYAAQHRWPEALEAASQGAELLPTVENLSYKADAQRALADLEGAAATEELIGTVAHVGRVKGLYDRALAVYYSEHGIHLPEALQIARHELSLRQDIYSQDTLAWAAAANGYWQEAESAIQQALRLNTEDPLLHFHAGMIAVHVQKPQQAVQQLSQALALNPHFHPRYAEQAREMLQELGSQTPDSLQPLSPLA